MPKRMRKQKREIAQSSDFTVDQPMVEGFWYGISISRDADLKTCDAKIKECMEGFRKKYKRDPATVFVYKKHGLVLAGPLANDEN